MNVEASHVLINHWWNDNAMANDLITRQSKEVKKNFVSFCWEEYIYIVKEEVSCMFNILYWVTAWEAVGDIFSVDFLGSGKPSYWIFHLEFPYMILPF